MRKKSMHRGGRAGYPVHNKWLKTEVLKQDSKLRLYIPETVLFRLSSLGYMLDKYRMVYVKPVVGSLGHGVMKVKTWKAKGKQRYAYQLNERKRNYSSLKALFHALNKETNGKRYLIQKGIRLLKYKGRPFDIRVMVQRSPRGGWEATGTVGRAAHPRKIVTNGSQGGTIYPTKLLLKAHGGKKRRAASMKAMNAVGIRIVKRLHHAYPVIREIGIDYGVDKGFKPWILEVNARPDPCPFALLPDQSMLRKIIRYGKGYGRAYRLHCVKARRGR